MENTGDIHFLWASIPLGILIGIVLFARILELSENWGRSYKSKQSQYRGIFKQWKFGINTIDFQHYSLWVGNGRILFEDYRSGDKQFLNSFTFRERNVLWKEYQKELRERVDEDISKMIKM